MRTLCFSWIKTRNHVCTRTRCGDGHLFSRPVSIVALVGNMLYLVAPCGWDLKSSHHPRQVLFGACKVLWNIEGVMRGFPEPSGFFAGFCWFLSVFSWVPGDPNLWLERNSFLLRFLHQLNTGLLDNNNKHWIDGKQ